jgi:hypothetical protein
MDTRHKTKSKCVAKQRFVLKIQVSDGRVIGLLTVAVENHLQVKEEVCRRLYKHHQVSFEGCYTELDVLKRLRIHQ